MTMVPIAINAMVNVSASLHPCVSSWQRQPCSSHERPDQPSIFPLRQPLWSRRLEAIADLRRWTRRSGCHPYRYRWR